MELTNDIDVSAAFAMGVLDTMCGQDRRCAFYLADPALAIDFDAASLTLRVMPVGLDYAFGMALEHAGDAEPVSAEFDGSDVYESGDTWPKEVSEAVSKGDVMPLDVEHMAALWLRHNRKLACKVANLWPLELTVFNVDADYVHSIALGRGLPDVSDDVALDIATEAATDANEALCETDVLDDVLDARIVDAIKAYHEDHDEEAHR